MRHILLVVRWPIGGIRTHLKYVYPLIYRELPGLKVTMIAPRTEHSETLERDLAALPITYVYLDVYCSFRTLVSTVRQQLSSASFDLVHSQGFTAGAAAALPANLRRVPHLMSVHDVIQDSQFTGVRGWARKLGMKALFGRIDLVHAVSDDVRENLIAHLGGRFSRRVRVVRNGILTRPILEARPRDLRAELGLGSDALLVGFFGRFMAQKGFPTLVEAIRLLRQSAAPGARRIHVAAFGGGGFVREEQAAIERAGLAEAFSFFPFVADIAGALKAVDVIAMPSLWEAAPLLPMEAMVAGVPVIGTSCIGLSEVLAGTPAVMLKPGDGAALAAAVAQEASSSSRSTAEAFVRDATSRFDVADRVPELLELMKQLTRPRSG
jgi:glycosyltransferase involved in cell wall biosynthesis